MLTFEIRSSNTRRASKISMPFRFVVMAGLGVLAIGGACSSSPGRTPSGAAGTTGAAGNAAGTSGAAGSAGSAAGTTGAAGDAGSGGAAGLAGAAGAAGGAGAGGSAGGAAGAAGSAPDGGAGAGGAAGTAACSTDPGFALQFRGTGDDRVHADITNLPIMGASRTIEMWAYFDGSNLSHNNEHGLFEYGAKGGCHEFGLNSTTWGPGQTLGMIHPYGNCNEVDNFFNFPADTFTNKAGWVHLSMSYDATGKQFHFTINGNEPVGVGTGAGAAGRTHPIGMWPGDAMFTTTKSPLRIGTTDDFQGPPGWQGKIDELRVWNVYRTPAEIKANMKVMLKGNEPGLAAYFKFDEGTGLSSKDKTGDATNVANFVGTDKAMWPMWTRSDIPGPFTCAP